MLAEQAGVKPDGAQAWVVENGISDGTAPDRNVSREEFAAMLWRRAGRPASASGLDTYADSGTVHEWAAEAMAWALETGVLPTENDKLLAGADASRVHIITALGA